MADESYPYSPDRYDQEADAVTFHGAHRAEEPFWRQNLVYIVIIAVALALLVALLLFIGSLNRNNNGPDAGPTPTTEETTDPADEEQPGEEEEPAPEADRSTEVLVLNAGGINGLAATWQETLGEQGWENIAVDTAAARQEEPVIFYRDEADRGTAEALAADAGVSEVRQSDEYDSPVTFLAVTEPGAQSEGEGEG